MKKLIYILLCLSTTFTIKALGNEYIYWVQFTTKASTPYSIEKPEEFLSERAIKRRALQGIAIDSTDLPVSPAFIDSISQLGFSVKHTSRWLNGAIAYLPDSINVDTLLMPSFVEKYELRKGTPTKSLYDKFNEPDTLIQQYYGNSYIQNSMLNTHIVHQYATGHNVHIAVIDAGFYNADQMQYFDSLYARGGVLGTYNFVNPGQNVYNEHSHGTSVLSVMATNIPGTFVGTAPGASYWLLLSEDVRSEFPVEEDYWVVAAEFADSVGCDVVNTSLGYSTFDDPFFDHTYEMYTGNTLRISQATNMAVLKGMVMVSSAGNSGTSPWKHITAPAEAKKGLAVAAVNNSREIVGFSSRGFEHEGALQKPDVAAMGQGVFVVGADGNVRNSSGTSFSSPLIAGMAACLVELFPEKTASEIIELIRILGDRHPEHSAEYGFGIPDFSSIADSVKNRITDPDTRLILHDSSTKVLIFPNPFHGEINLVSKEAGLTLEIYTIAGQKIFSTYAEGTYTRLNNNKLSSLPKGLYVAVLKGKETFETIKLIKE